MGGSSGTCTGRECCGVGDPEVAKFTSRDGKWYRTLEGGAQELPDGASCFQVLMIEDGLLIPAAVANMMKDDDRAIIIRSLCGRLLECGIGPPPDLERLLIEFVPRFKLQRIDTYLTHEYHKEKSSSARSARWFIFVDRDCRDLDPNYEPPGALKTSEMRSMMTKVFAGNPRYQLEVTRQMVRECDYGRVDFSGYWKETVYEGDMDSFLKDVGWTRISRRIGKVFNYGVGRNEQVIDHQGNILTIKMITPAGEFINTVVIGGGTQKVTGADGKRLSLCPVWVDDGHAVLTEQWTPGKPRVRVKRYLRTTVRHSGIEKEMVLKMISPKQYVAKRIFVNCNELNSSTPRPAA